MRARWERGGTIVTAPEPRIVAVTDSTALVIGLTCLPTGWDVVCHATEGVRHVELASADVVVLDLDSMETGFDLVPSGARTVLIGDNVPDEELPDGAAVLLRPYTLPQLQDLIEELLRPAPGAEADDGPSDALSEPVPAVDAAAANSTTHPPRRSHSAPLAVRLFGRITTKAADDLPSDALAADRGGQGEEEAVPSSPAVSASEVAPETGADATDQVDPVVEPVIDLTKLPAAASSSQRPSRRLSRRQRRTGPGEAQLRERLAAVLAAISELERLVEQVPMLNSLDDLAEAIVGDLHAQLEADTVGLWRLGTEGWQLLAHRGLTPHESRLRVPLDQPLFAEVDHAGGAMLIDPVDAVQAAVAGIGGAHTESFMAASIAAGTARLGILAVGRNRPLTEGELDRLVDAASEAAPGIAVAEQLARLRGPTEVKVPEQIPARSWHRLD
jgi:hypothetical protein